jgi:hypothetical protein
MSLIANHNMSLPAEGVLGDEPGQAENEVADPGSG